MIQNFIHTIVCVLCTQCVSNFSSGTTFAPGAAGDEMTGAAGGGGYSGGGGTPTWDTWGPGTLGADGDLALTLFNFTSVLDPSDPLYENEVEVTCFSHPIPTTLSCESHSETQTENCLFISLCGLCLTLRQQKRRP